MKRIVVVLAMVLCIPLTAYMPSAKAAEEKKEAKEVKVEEKVLAVVNGVKITEKDFNDELDSVPANYRAMINANKKKFLDDLVLQELLAQEAKKQGLDKDKELIKSLEKIKSKLLAKTVIEKQVIDATKISEDDMKKYYEDHKKDFEVPEQINASHILVKTKEGATDAENKAALEKAEGLLKKIKGGADFATLAKESSDCPSSAKGGELGLFSKGQMVPEFEEAAFKLKPGEVSGVVKTKFGYHIIKITDKKEPRTKDFNEVKGEIENRLLKEKQKAAFEEYTKKLKDSAKVTVNEDLLK